MFRALLHLFSLCFEGGSRVPHALLVYSRLISSFLQCGRSSVVTSCLASSLYCCLPTLRSPPRSSPLSISSTFPSSPCNASNDQSTSSPSGIQLPHLILKADCFQRPRQGYFQYPFSGMPPTSTPWRAMVLRGCVQSHQLHAMGRAPSKHVSFVFACPAANTGPLV